MFGGLALTLLVDCGLGLRRQISTTMAPLVFVSCTTIYIKLRIM